MGAIINIILGVVSGILTNAFSNYFKKTIIPYYQTIKYKGINIEGEWIVEHISTPTGGGTLRIKRKTIVRIEQKAHNLIGTANSVASFDDGTEDMLVYDVSGEITDRFAIVNFKVNDKTRIAYSSFLLEVTNDGHTLKGFRTFYGMQACTIRAIQCIWRRNIPHLNYQKSKQLNQSKSHLELPNVELETKMVTS
ncbi:MAG TPA: hypothetical protein PLO56_06240 [Rhodothermales bacterium]|nr:hypothetical protein [Rhodothermales bacterium]